MSAGRQPSPPERREEDRIRLKELFYLAAHIPILKEALDWAHAHNIEFIIDQTSTAGGYYIAGTGVVALARFRDSDVGAIRALVHEIRHAWQDVHGMIPTVASSFQNYYIKTSLIEADAWAFEAEAERQYWADYDDTSMDKILQQDQNASMWKNFKAWYSSWRARSYGVSVSTDIGVKLGIPGATPNQFKCEYQEGSPRIAGIKLSDTQDLSRLGQKLNCGNYFPADHYQFLKERVLPPALARTFYGAANNNQRQTVAEIRKRQKGRVIVV